MATLREKRPGVWEVRVFTGTDARRPADPAVQDDPRRQARGACASPPRWRSDPAASSSGGRSVSDVLDAWVEQNLDDVGAVVGTRSAEPRQRASRRTRSPGSRVARLSVGDVERWHTRLRRAGMRDAGIKNQHGVLRAALAQAVRWGWVEHQRGEHGATAVDEDASAAR